MDVVVIKFNELCFSNLFNYLKSPFVDSSPRIILGMGICYVLHKP